MGSEMGEIHFVLIYETDAHPEPAVHSEGLQFFEGVLKLLESMDKCIRIISKRDIYDLIR
jgi:hypothetical protein